MKASDFSKFLTQYLTHYLPVQRNLSCNTIRSYRDMVQANVNPVFIKDYLGHADISTTEVYARADNEAKRAALEKATAHLDLPKASQWEQDAELIEWLSSLG